MFGIFRKRIPAPEIERQRLVQQLVLHRCETDPEAQIMAMVTETDPSDLPAEILMALPEATVLRVVEQFYTMLDQGATEEFAIKTLNEMHAALLAAAGEDLPQIGRAATLFQYVRHIVDALHGHGGPISDAFLIDAIQEIKSYYKR
jgi:hypothetical protein